MADEIKIDLDELDAKKGTPAPKLNDLRPQTEEKPEKEVAVAQEETKNTLSADEGIAKLQKQLDTERNARISAEKRAQEAAEREAKALGETQTTQLDLVKNAITAVTQQNDWPWRASTPKRYRFRDFAAAAKINREDGRQFSESFDSARSGQNGTRKAAKAGSAAGAGSGRAVRVQHDPKIRRVGTITSRIRD